MRTNGVGLHELLMGIVVENLAGRLFVKLALCSMLGFSEEELRGTHSVDFPEDASKDQALIQQLRAVMTCHPRKGGAALFPT